MYLIQHITSLPLQTQTLILDDGTPVLLTIYFRPMQLGWFINELTYGDFTLTGMQIVNNPNLLNQYRNRLPFGLGCFSTGNRDPQLQQDFSSGASKLYILSADEVVAYARFLQGG